MFFMLLEVKHLSYLHLTCATRWHFNDITGNWLYWIYICNFLLKYTMHIEKCTLDVKLCISTR
jgi:hypothetical protein